jgi:hypothetical protein
VTLQNRKICRVKLSAITKWHVQLYQMARTDDQGVVDMKLLHTRLCLTVVTPNVVRCTLLSSSVWVQTPDPFLTAVFARNSILDHKCRAEGLGAHMSAVSTLRPTRSSRRPVPVFRRPIGGGFCIYELLIHRDVNRQAETYDAGRSSFNCWCRNRIGTLFWVFCQPRTGLHNKKGV